MNQSRLGFAVIGLFFLIGLVISQSFPIKPSHAYHSGMDASVVVGQENFTSSLADNSHPEKGYGFPYITSDGTRLFIADCNGNRVLIYNSPPTDVATTPPDVVIGQPDLTSINANQGGNIAANTLRCPGAVIVVGTKLLVADSNNGRVLVFNQIPTSNNASADVVIRQPDMNTSNYACNATTSRDVVSIFYDEDSGKLLMSESGGHRVLVYNSIPTTNGVAADVVVGQSSLTGCNANQGGAVGANKLRNPRGILVADSKLLVADGQNNRVLIFNTIPAANNASADVVIGQPDMVTATFPFSRTAATLARPESITYNGTELVVSDKSANRVLVYGSIPASNGASATAVIGQTSFAGGTSGVTSQKLNNPASVEFIGSNLYVADNMNHRILKFDSLTTDAVASTVYGQKDFISKLPFAAEKDGSHLSRPQGVATDGTRLFVSDTENNRVLIYNSIPTSPGAEADVVIGQPDMTSTLANQGASANRNANTLSGPTSIYTDGEKLFIVDGGNGRLLIFNQIPTTNNASADIVVGQPTMITTEWSGTIAATSYSWINGVFYDKPSGKLIVTDGGASRVLIYNSLPTTNGAAADVVVGQSDFTSEVDCAWNNATSDCLYFNYSTAIVADGHLVVPDNVANRVLIWNSIPTTNKAPADVVLGQTNFQTMDYGGADVPYSATSIARPNGAAYDGKRLYLSDGDSCRILVFNQIPTTNGQAADMVLGKSDLNSGGCDSAANSTNFKTTNLYGGPISAAGNILAVSDLGFSRAIIYRNPIPQSSQLSASSALNDKTPAISWSFTDGDPGDVQNAYQLQLDTTSTFNSGNLRDTGVVISSSTQHIVSTDLTDGLWYARVQLTDSQGDVGEWGEVLAFRVGVMPVPAQVFVNGQLAVKGSKILVSTQRPTFTGIAEPLSEITIEVGGLVLATNTNANGSWSVTPASDLPVGEYTVKVTASQSGITSESYDFILGVSVEVPATGANYWLLRLGGLAAIIVGGWLLYWQRQSVQLVVIKIIRPDPPHFPR